MRLMLNGVFWSERVKRIYSFLGGLMLGVAAPMIFPPFPNVCAGYIAIIVFLTLLIKRAQNGRSLFWFAYIFGFSFYAVGFSWITNALLIDNEKFASFVPLVFFAIGGFFALFWAFPAYFMRFGKNVTAKVLILCVSFVLFEWIRSFIFTGFPWNLLGTALSFDVRLIQGAAYIGTYGLSFLLLMMLCGISLLFIKGERKFAIVFCLLPLMCLFLFALRYKPITDFSDFKVRLVQPNIPQTFKWNRELAEKNFRTYIDMSKKESLDDVRLVVWGETASPYFLDRDEKHLNEITEAISDNGFLVTGLLRTGYENGYVVPYNSMFVIDKAGNIKDYYDKAHLVPFGEFLPFREYLPDFMHPVADVVGDLGRGEKYKSLRVSGLPLMGGAICYESIFPHEVINTKDKPEILLVLANDGWYGISAGPYQHLVAAQMRAVEEGVTVVRSANTGISAVIGLNGDILGQIGLDISDSKDVILPKVLSKHTLYGQYGNLLVFFLFFLILLLNTIIGCVRVAKKSI